mmetsp:Transcript_103650/g.206074  ORF Transcript_103650/g.206074 Transcript_103650/m.206074 type:complete len:228 (+) Transcript_103650:39-722(+)|eukprot:CAMPEP_0172733096 /NCGR_PEP_ID=MMETSP1074-20121228/106141_1 /TAXON_ID=2916 /ORGANISM="Ceratium fusus, Strain PA161109" /LENGTH=227 /DNA_ID=CAMNT_0013561541 /DNA_START=21 /DNA_END=704 /DNA_ORIENTATION=+
MTTAHRPTWNAAVASGSNPSGGLFVAQSTKVSNRDASSFLSVKTRKLGQGMPEELKSRREFREELEKKEKQAQDERSGKKDNKAGLGYDKAPVSLEDNPFPEDADEDGAPGSDSEKSSGDDDDDDDTEELMRELEKIKQERQAEEDKQRQDRDMQNERARRDEIMKGNPLVSNGDLSLKRRWDDDTVFKNQARTIPKEKMRFINDAVRSDFHRKFLNKYVWVDGTAH